MYKHLMRYKIRKSSHQLFFPHWMIFDAIFRLLYKKNKWELKYWITLHELYRKKTRPYKILDSEIIIYVWFYLSYCNFDVFEMEFSTNYLNWWCFSIMTLQLSASKSDIFIIKINGNFKVFFLQSSWHLNWIKIWMLLLNEAYTTYIMYTTCILSRYN